MTLSKFLTKTIIKGAILLCMIVLMPTVVDAMVPIITNDIALGQMENSNDAYILMQTYGTYMSIARFGIGTIMVCLGLSMGLDTYIFTKSYKKEK